MKSIFAAAFICLFVLSGAACGADSSKARTEAKKTPKAKTAQKGSPAKPDSTKPRETKLPKLVDLGAKKCVPCKMMAPILEGLKSEYKDSFETVFIDVWEDSEAGKTYRIRVIPTQIFFDPDGKELFRHEGFYSKEDILKKWKELGYEAKR